MFPTTQSLGLPVIAYTALQHGAVAVTLCAPQTRAQLDEGLRVLDAGGPLTDEEYAALAEHGERVRRHAGGFR